MKRLLAYVISFVLLLTVAFVPLSATAAEQVAPPVVAQVTATEVYLDREQGYEYSLNGNQWWTTAVYTELKPETEYIFYRRRAGKPETKSEALVVKTLPLSPSTTVVVPPVLDYADTETIVLVDQDRYEYRINGGAWQPAHIFEHLQPDTEYVIEQRLVSWMGHLPSEPSEPLVVKTHARGPSTYTNYERVQEFIDTYGEESEDGYKFVAFSIQDEYGSEYVFGIGNNKYGIDMELFYNAVDEFGLVFDVQVELLPKSNYIDGKLQVALVDGDMIVEERDPDIFIRRQDYNLDYEYSSNRNGTYLTTEYLSQLGTAGMQMMFGVWDEIFYTELGFGMKGLGFTSFEGYGEAVCDPASKQHIGTYVEYHQRDAACGIEGRSASLYCSTCGELVQLGQYIAPTAAHTYDNNCDDLCNTCGFGRPVRHRYTYSCSTDCAVCGSKREPLQDHTLLASGVCTVCWTSFRIMGDVTGDGQINMGDVSKLYAHIRGTKKITDSVALKSSDVNGDGKVNMGDISRLYAHIRGTNLLS